MTEWMELSMNLLASSLTECVCSNSNTFNLTSIRHKLYTLGQMSPDLFVITYSVATLCCSSSSSAVA